MSAFSSPLYCRLGLQQGLCDGRHDPGASARPRGRRAAAALWATPDGAAGLPSQLGQTGLLTEDAIHLLSVLLPGRVSLVLFPAIVLHQDSDAISPRSLS